MLSELKLNFAKCITQIEGVDFNDTFSAVSSKDSFKTIMALLAHWDHMDVKTAFLSC